MRKNSIHDTMEVVRRRCEINEDTGCFEWQGHLSNKGYGRIRYKQKWTEVHRAVWSYHNGPLNDGECVLHKCDNRKCCATSHLYIGSNEQNILDKMVRDRSGKSLDIAKVVSIKKMLAKGISQTAIAKEYNVGQPTISKIYQGKTWSHVSPGEN